MGGLDGAAANVTGFEERGFAGPVRLFGDAEWPQIARRLMSRAHPPPEGWSKGRAVTDRAVYDVAARPALVDLLTALLGPDVILWGATIVRRRPGQSHPWHTDIESSSPEGGFVSVWIGLENTSPESSLQLIPGSHRFGIALQQAAQERGVRRGDATPDAVLGWARSFDPRAVLAQPPLRDGDALLFDGRLWHGSHNTRESGERTALLLQFAAANVAVREPDFRRTEWPFRFYDQPRPPVIVVSGTAPEGINRIVPPPVAQEGVLASGVHALPRPLAGDAASGWKRYPLFRGATPLLASMGCHASVLSAGCSPHPPHAHPEEEILIVLEGEADIELADDPFGRNGRVHRLAAGSFSYYPAGQHHTIRNPGPGPVSYLMFKWTAADSGARAPLAPSTYVPSSAGNAVSSRFRTIGVMEGATDMLTRLHCHVSVVPPGGGYDRHVDSHDVALVVLEGRIETLGTVVEPWGVAYCAAGTPHGLRNPGAEAARYLAFEFVGRGRGEGRAGRAPLAQRLRYVAAKALRIARRRLGAWASKGGALTASR